MEQVSEASEAAKTEPEPAAKTPRQRQDKSSKRPDPQDRPVTSNRPKTPKDRSLQGKLEQLEGVEQYGKDKIKQGAGAGERGEQPGGYKVYEDKSKQDAGQSFDKIRSLKEAVEDQQQKDAVEDEKQRSAEEDEKPDDQ